MCQPRGSHHIWTEGGYQLNQCVSSPDPGPKPDYGSSRPLTGGVGDWFLLRPQQAMLHLEATPIRMEHSILAPVVFTGCPPHYKRVYDLLHFSHTRVGPQTVGKLPVGCPQFSQWPLIGQGFGHPQFIVATCFSIYRQNIRLVPRVPPCTHSSKLVIPCPQSKWPFERASWAWIYMLFYDRRNAILAKPQ